MVALAGWYTRYCLGRFCLALLLALSCFSSNVRAESDPLPEDARVSVIEFMLQQAIAQRLINGAVVVVGDHRGILYERAVGLAGFSDEAPALTTAAVFDVASLTKVFATTPAIVKLLDEGRLSLLDPISSWFAEFEGSDITILNLLTHTSGLHDVGLDRSEPMQSAINRAAAQIGRVAVGSRFKYADINFILLGELVRRISGLPLDRYAHQMFYAPLGMQTASFTPVPNDNNTPTLGNGRTALTGVVQDENARILGGVAGHAGLFSSVHDLARFAGMLLSGGQLDGTRVLSSRAVAQMTAPYFFRNGSVVRGLGWDRESPFSAPKGTIFSEFSYGHTGYSGTSVWIDPDADLFVLLLTTRVDYQRLRSFNKLRGDISTLAAALFVGRERRGMLERPVNPGP
ncbi:MAG: serine hydrolase domain-containing protein [Geobacter sp.]|jgi:serine-type D-Ala-D-Ala carboxypeptidase